MNQPFRYLDPDGAIVTLPPKLRLIDAVLHLRQQHLRLTGQQVRAGKAVLHVTARVH